MLILSSPNRENIRYDLDFNFKASNNESKYEALIAGLQLEVKMLIKKGKAFCWFHDNKKSS